MLHTFDSISLLTYFCSLSILTQEGILGVCSSFLSCLCTFQSSMPSSHAFFLWSCKRISQSLSIGIMKYQFETQILLRMIRKSELAHRFVTHLTDEQAHALVLSLHRRTDYRHSLENANIPTNLNEPTRPNLNQLGTKTPNERPEDPYDSLISEFSLQMRSGCNFLESRDAFENEFVRVCFQKLALEGQVAQLLEQNARKEEVMNRMRHEISRLSQIISNKPGGVPQIMNSTMPQERVQNSVFQPMRSNA